jgi:hypothetical protein
MMNIDELYLRDWIGLSFISQEPPVFDGQAMVSCRFPVISPTILWGKSIQKESCSLWGSTGDSMGAPDMAPLWTTLPFARGDFSASNI